MPSETTIRPPGPRAGEAAAADGDQAGVLELRDCTAADAAAIGAIYNYYVQQTTITFEESAVPAAEMARRIEDVTGRFPWLVGERDGEVLGYAYAAPWKTRSAYRHSVETTVYVSPHAAGRGIGRTLYHALIERLRSQGVHRAVGGIALPNPASVALHEKLGFVRIGQFDEIGLKFGRWLDVGYWELRL
jgi:L-amino acid N-acyltransferase YncA